MVKNKLHTKQLFYLASQSWLARQSPRAVLLGEQDLGKQAGRHPGSGSPRLGRLVMPNTSVNHYGKMCLHKQTKPHSCSWETSPLKATGIPCSTTSQQPQTANATAHTSSNWPARADACLPATHALHPITYVALKQNRDFLKSLP